MRSATDTTHDHGPPRSTQSLSPNSRQSQYLLTAVSAFHVTARCDASGYAAIHPRHMAKLCRYTSRDLALPVLEALLSARWLHRLVPGPRAGDPIKVTLTRQARRLAPGATLPPEPTGPCPKPSPITVQGRGYEIAAWVDAYVARHHHGPPTRELLAAHCEKVPAAPPWTEQMLTAALQRLAEDGWLRIDGSRWYRTRPGPTYLRRLAREQAAEHAVSPRAQRRPSTDAETQALRGLWAVPGAAAVLGPRPRR